MTVHQQQSDLAHSGAPADAAPPREQVKGYTILWVPSTAHGVSEYLKIVSNEKVAYRVDTEQGSFLPGATITLSAAKVDIPGLGDCNDSSLGPDAFREVATCVMTKTKKLEFKVGDSSGSMTPVEIESTDRVRMRLKHAGARQSFTFPAHGSQWTWVPKEREFAGWNTKGDRISWGKDKWALELFPVDHQQSNFGDMVDDNGLGRASHDTSMSWIHYTPLQDPPAPPLPPIWSKGRPLADVIVYEQMNDDVILSAIAIALGIDERDKRSHGKDSW